MAARIIKTVDKDEQRLLTDDGQAAGGTITAVLVTRVALVRVTVVEIHILRHHNATYTTHDGFCLLSQSLF